MKAPRFDYVRPTSVEEAVRALTSGVDAKPIAGGQSLGPMLNLRVAQPALLVDVRRLDELLAVSEDADSVTYGAGLTHAQFEDGVLPDATRGLLARVAADIAYRAVRNRGTLGGSLCHADPAGDWVNVFAMLPASAIIAGPRGRREEPMHSFFRGLFETAVAADEILVAVRVRRLSAQARTGYWKFCRKPGEFSEATGAVIDDPALGVCRAVIGATRDRPHVIGDARGLLGGVTRDAIAGVLDAAVGDDAYERQLHHVALARAIGALPAERRSP